MLTYRPKLICILITDGRKERWETSQQTKLTLSGQILSQIILGSGLHRVTISGPNDSANVRMSHATSHFMFR